jgi:5-methylcytosine-specific restriction protein A
MSTWPYNSATWARLRRLKLEHNVLCEECFKIGRLELAVAVDHVIAISAGGEPFPPPDELRSLCISCHNRKTRVVDQQGKELTTKGCDVSGMPLDPVHPWRRGAR